MIADWASWILLGTGSFFVLIGGIGMLRMPDLYTRMHACSVTETIATILIIGGLMLQTGMDLATFKLFAVLLFLLFTGPVAAYALANSALIAGVTPKVVDDPIQPSAQPIAQPDLQPSETPPKEPTA
jgi:multicomponent Na+:H+ antiporter subunit G